MNEIENTLRSLLRNNIVSFTFKKVNGEIRHALGTRNLTLASAYTNTRIPTPTGNMQPNSYYDVQSNGWRSWKTGCVISIDGYAPVEKVSREIPVQKPVEDMPKHYTDDPIDLGFLGGDIAKAFGGVFGGFGGGVPKEEIRKSMDKLGKDIEIVPLGGKGGFGGGAPVSGGKVGTPTFTDKGVELEMGIGVEDFAKMVAHYVVEELVSRIKSL